MAANSEDASGLHRPIKYRPDIDGLRAIAVTSVVAYHVGLGAVGGGFVGVDIFFVISGYLIGSLVYKEIRGGSFSIARFYQRRAKRILPALLGVLGFTYIAALLLLSPVEMKAFAQSALATIGSSSNIYFWLGPGYFSPTSELMPLLMTWSLGVEEQFYIFFPLLMLLFRKASWKTILSAVAGLAGASLVLSMWGTKHYPTPTFYLLPTRAWELATGVLLAIYEARSAHARKPMPQLAAHALSLVGLACLAIAICLLNNTMPFPGLAALLPVAGAALVIAARTGVVNRVLSWRPLPFIGLISYSWYLWHWPMLSFARLASDGALSVPAALAVALLSFGCAALSYKFIEQPFRKSTTPTGKLLLRYAALMAIAIVPAGLFYASNGLPQRNRQVQQMELAGLDPDFCTVQGGSANLRSSAKCMPGGSGKAVALIGDSHAAALADALRDIAGDAGYRLLEMDKFSCPPLIEVSRTLKAAPAFYRECAQFNRKRLDYVLHDANVQVVVLAGLWSSPFEREAKGERYVPEAWSGEAIAPARSRELLQQGLSQLIEKLEAAHKIVYLVQDDAAFSFDPMRYMLNRTIGPRFAVASLIHGGSLPEFDGVAPDPDLPYARDARGMVARVAAEHPGVRVIDLHDALCSGGQCRFAEGQETLYADDNHVSALGARRALAGVRLP